MHLSLGLLVVAVALSAAPSPVKRDVPATNERLSPRVSPDGKRLAYLALDSRGVNQLWVKTLGQDDERLLTSDERGGPRTFWWVPNSRALVYLYEVAPDVPHLYLVEAGSGNARDLTPFLGVRAELVKLSPRVPEQLLVALNLRDRTRTDVYRVNLRTGAVELDTENPGSVVAWSADSELVVRGAKAVLPNGETQLRVRPSALGRFETIARAPRGDGLELLDFSADGSSVFLALTPKGEPPRVLEKHLLTGEERVIAEPPQAEAAESKG